MHQELKHAIIQSEIVALCDTILILKNQQGTSTPEEESNQYHGFFFPGKARASSRPATYEILLTKWEWEV